MEHSRLEPGTYVRADQVLAVVPFARATLWRLVKSGQFPAPVKLTPGVTAWKADTVQAWLDERHAA